MQRSRPNFAESTLARGWADAKRLWTGWRFALASLIGSLIVAYEFADARIIAVVLVIFVISALLYSVLRAPYVQRNELRIELNELLKFVDFDDVRCWSMTIEPGWHFALIGDTVILKAWTFKNHSKKVQRTLDLTITIGQENDDVNDIKLRTRDSRHQPYRDSLLREFATHNKIIKSLLVLENPIVVPPSTIIEGDVEFALHKDDKKKIGMDKIKRPLIIKSVSIYELLSEQTRQFKPYNKISALSEMSLIGK